MKDVFLFTKKIKLNFNSNDVSILSVQHIIEEVEKEYKLVDPFPAINTFESYQYLTFRVVKKEIDKRPLGFSVGK